MLRDASGYRTHRHTINSGPSALVPSHHALDETTAGAVSRCGRLLAEFTEEDPANVPASRRCSRPGCRQAWETS